MPKLNVEKLEKKFTNLTKSRDSIQNLAGWILLHKHTHQEICEEWLKAIKRSEIHHRLTLFYLANDVLQHCKKKNASEYKSSFAEVLGEAVLLSRDTSIKREVLRMINIWKERSVYDEEFLKNLENAVREDDSIDSCSHVSRNSFDFMDDDDYFPIDELVDTAEIERAKKKQEEPELGADDFKLKHFISCLRNLDVVKDAFVKARGEVDEFDYQLPDIKSISALDAAIISKDASAKACEVLTNLIGSGQKSISAQRKVIKQLKMCQQVYSEMDEEVKKAAAAFKIYGKKLSHMKTKLTEKIATYPDPRNSSFLSPLSDASQDQISPQFVPFISSPTFDKAPVPPHNMSLASPGLSESRLSLDKRLSLMLNSRNPCLPPAFASAVAEFKETKPEPVKASLKSPLMSTPPFRSQSGSSIQNKQPAKRKLDPLSPPILSEKCVPPAIGADTSKEMLNAIIELAKNPIDAEEYEVKRPKVKDIIMNFSEVKLHKLKPVEQPLNGLEGLVEDKVSTPKKSKNEIPEDKSYDVESTALHGYDYDDSSMEESAEISIDDKKDPDSKTPKDVKPIDTEAIKPKNEERLANDSKTVDNQKAEENANKAEKIVLNEKKPQKAETQKTNNSLPANKVKVSCEVNKKHTSTTTKSKDLDSAREKSQSASKVKDSDQKLNKHVMVVHKSKSSSDHKINKVAPHKVKSGEQQNSHSKDQTRAQNVVKKDDVKIKSNHNMVKKEHKRIEIKEQKPSKDSPNVDQTPLKDPAVSKEVKENPVSPIKKDPSVLERPKQEKSSSSSMKSSSSEFHRSNSDSRVKSSHQDSSESGKIVKTSSSKSHSETVKSLHTKDQTMKPINNSLNETEKYSNSAQHSNHKIGSSSSSHSPSFLKTNKEERKHQKSSSSSHHKSDPSSHGEKKLKQSNNVQSQSKPELLKSKGSQEEMMKKLEKTPLVVLEKLTGNYPVYKEHFNSPRDSTSNVESQKKVDLPTTIASETTKKTGEKRDMQPNGFGETKRFLPVGDPLSTNSLSDKNQEKSGNQQRTTLHVPLLSILAKNRMNSSGISYPQNTDGVILSPTGCDNLDLAEVIEVNFQESALTSKSKEPAGKDSGSATDTSGSQVSSRAKRVIHTRARTREEFVSKHNFMVCLLESLKLLNNITSKAKPVFVAPRKKSYPDAIPIQTVHKILSCHDKKTCLLSSLMGRHKDDQDDFKCVTQSKVTQDSSSSGAERSGDIDVPSASSGGGEKGSNLDHVDMEIDSEGEEDKQ